MASVADPDDAAVAMVQAEAGIWSIAGPVLLLLVFGVIGLQWHFKQKALGEQAERERDDGTEDTDRETDSVNEELPNHPHLQACFVPFSGEALHYPNKRGPDKDGAAYNYENDLAIGSAMVMHRATYDSALDKSGDYPFGYMFEGNRKKWEVRMQVRLKKMPDGTPKFGIELDRYVPLMGATKVAMRAVVSALKYIVGDDLHHSPGDDPAVTAGEAERPIFSMPLWAFDQFIETPEGEEAPCLTDRQFTHLGIRRADDVGAFAKHMNGVRLKPGPTYTFSFWSISTLLDNVMWRIGGVVPGMTIDFDQFAGRPPVHLILYTLTPPPAGHEQDKRHLDSRKNYLFHLAFWSSIRPPPSDRLQELLPRTGGAVRDALAMRDRRKKETASASDVGERRGLQGAALRAAPSQRSRPSCFACFEGLRASSSKCVPAKTLRVLN